MLLAGQRDQIELTKLHAARHSYATWLIASGVDIAIVSKLLGHSEITTEKLRLSLLNSKPDFLQ